MLILSIPSAYMNKYGISTLAEAETHLADHLHDSTLGGWSDYINEVSFKVYLPFHEWLSIVSGESDAITYPLLIGLFLLLTFLVHRRSLGHDTTIRSMLFFLTTYFYLWWLLGAGGSWYGMLLFCLPFVFLIKGVLRPQNVGKEEQTWSRILKTSSFLCVCGIWIFMAFTFRAANYNPKDVEWAKQIYVPPLVEYQTGKFTEDQIVNMVFYRSSEMIKLINRTDGRVYRVGTHMNFFIDNNDRRVFSDTFLDTYEKLVRKYKDKEKIVTALKERGFEYIVFDLNLSTTDRTPEKSLTRKFTNFINTLYANPKVELVMTDRTIKMNDSGKIVPSLIPDKGTIVNYGKWAIFRIK